MSGGTAQAIILAAGRGERMRPLTDVCPKPLLRVGGRPLIEWHILACARAGVRDIVINTAWLEDQFPAVLGDGGRLGVRLRYSHEGRDFGAALETAGGICRALPLLAERFWVMAGDVWCPGLDLADAAAHRALDGGAGAGSGAAPGAACLAHITLVPNPPHNPRGDFGLSGAGLSGAALALNLPADAREPRHTYSTIGLYSRALFEAPWCDIPPGNPQGIRAALAPLLRRAMDNGRIGAALHTGAWTDVGTPARLAELNTQIERKHPAQAAQNPA